MIVDYPYEKVLKTIREQSISVDIQDLFSVEEDNRVEEVIFVVAST